MYVNVVVMVLFLIDVRNGIISQDAKERKESFRRLKGVCKIISELRVRLEEDKEME